jgi:hypothetical protein
MHRMNPHSFLDIPVERLSLIRYRMFQPMRLCGPYGPYWETRNKTRHIHYILIARRRADEAALIGNR